jgi:hypothetical protein
VAQRKTPTKTKSPARKSTRAASRKTKSSSAKSSSTKTKAAKAAKPKSGRGEEELSIDRRRGARRETDAASNDAVASVVPPARLERRKKVNRRRQIDPTTCERDYTDDEIQFMNALDDYKRASGRMFPTCSEVLEVIRSLGYIRLSPSELATQVLPEPFTPFADKSEAELVGAAAD